MKKTNRAFMLTGALALSTLVAASGARAADEFAPPNGTKMRKEARGAMNSLTSDSRPEMKQTAIDALTVYKKFVSSGLVPMDLLKDADCVAIFPELTSLALGVGAEHGDGMVTCKAADGYSMAAPIDITSASIGAQLGAKKTQLLLLIRSAKAKQQLIDGMLVLGADATVSAWTNDRKSVGGEVTNKGSDVLAFAEDRGMFAGAALNGSQVKIDPVEVKNLYGRSITNAVILSSRPDENAPLASREFVNSIGEKP